jgi:hypothetical protein
VQSAFRVLQRVIATSEGETPKPARKNVVSITSRRKDPAAVALGRKGGLKSGKARMEKISPDERRRIASDAARARWAKEKGGG